jgi:hypothetical protein
MRGISESTFSPNTPLTRAMLVTIIYRYEGEPEVSEDNPFADVAPDQWYTNAVIWASANGIIEGYGNGLFGTNDNITREQLAMMLYRYANWKELDTSVGAALSNFTDADSISSWALEAMKWVIATGLINGRTETTLAALETTTRAEAATMIMRFIEGFIKA